MFDFNRLIEQHLHREHYPKTIGKYYPSEIGSCLRRVWFSYKYPRKTEPGLFKIFQVGNILHDFIVEVLRSKKTPEVELIRSEFPFKMDMKDFMVSGRVDNLILLKIHGKLVLVEVKSTKYVDSIEKPQLHHERQIQVYMHVLGVANGMLLYVQKDNLETRSFEVEYERAKAEQVIERFKLLHKCLSENKVPEPEAKEDKRMQWMCKYCDYADRC